MRKLVIYPNLSLGGVTSVLRGRASHEPETDFDFVFLNDRGGSAAFDSFPRVEARVVELSRARNYLTYVFSRITYEDISVLSQPDLANFVAADPDRAVTYEFHSSDMGVIQNELNKLEIENLARIAAPSDTMVEKIAGLLPARYRARVQKIPNLVDSSVFTKDGEATLWEGVGPLRPWSIPLVWVGRFDNGKGFRYFARLLARLPDHYVGYVIVSLEDSPTRPAAFLNEANSMNVADRVHILSNVDRPMMANIYRSARDKGGWLVSTSLMESFGYAVVEALACGLRVAAFELPPFHDFQDKGDLRMVPIGSVRQLTEAIHSNAHEGISS